jgi:CRISPR-associated protein Csb2
MPHLCVSIAPLDPLFHGKGDDDEPEWPPSPMRVFQSLLAGCRAGCRQRTWSEQKADAFRWLEERGAPCIVAPEACLTNGYTFFVPNNDSDKVSDRQERLTSKQAHPYMFISPDDDSDGANRIHYLWRIGEDEWSTARIHAETLCNEARQILALGWGIDQAIGFGRILNDGELASLKGKAWQPWQGLRQGQRTLRVPTRGSLNQLEQVHQSFLNRVSETEFRPVLRLNLFDTVTYLSAKSLPPRAYAAFEFHDGIAFRQSAANEVAAMVRSLACECAKKDTHVFPGGSESFVAGHVKEAKTTPPRFSYLPLPTIGHRHVDGMIRRVLITEPFGGDGSHARWVQDRLRNASLKDNEGKERAVLVGVWRASSRGVIDRYVSESTEWASVTPVVLPGFDDRDYDKAVKLCLQSLHQAEIPVESVKALLLRKAPFWPGALHPSQYRRPHYLKHLPAWHVRLVFRETMSGPLAIGAGRHCGLGIMAATI